MITWGLLVIVYFTALFIRGIYIIWKYLGIWHTYKVLLGIGLVACIIMATLGIAMVIV